MSIINQKIQIIYFLSKENDHDIIINNGIYN